MDTLINEIFNANIVNWYNKGFYWTFYWFTRLSYLINFETKHLPNVMSQPFCTCVCRTSGAASLLWAWADHIQQSRRPTVGSTLLAVISRRKLISIVHRSRSPPSNATIPTRTSGTSALLCLRAEVKRRRSSHPSDRHFAKVRFARLGIGSVLSSLLTF